MRRGTRLRETRLEKTLVTRAYQHRLGRSWELWLSWLATTTYTMAMLTADICILDQVLCRFVNYQYEQAAVHIWLVQYALLTIQRRYLFVKRHIPRAGDCVRS